MPLGIDSATPLSGNLANGSVPDHPINWNQLTTWWGASPQIVGRYFSGHFRWVRGELKGTPAANAAAVKYIIPLTRGGAAGETHGGNFVPYANSPLPYARDPLFNVNPGEQPLDFFPRLEGWDAHYQAATNDYTFNHQSDATARKNGMNDAVALCDYIVRMMRPDPATGALADLKWGTAGLMFVILDVEPQVKLRPAYWDGWSTGVICYTSDVIGLGNGFMPGIYCTLFPPDSHPGPAPCIPGVNTNPFIQAAFTDKKGWGNASIPLMGLQWVGPAEAPPPPASTEAELQAQWPSLTIITDCNSNPKKSFSPPVVIWQYILDAFWAPGDAEPHVPPEPPPNPYTFEVDLDCTSGTLYAGSPVVEYLLQPT